MTTTPTKIGFWPIAGFYYMALPQQRTAVHMFGCMVGLTVVNAPIHVLFRF